MIKFIRQIQEHFSERKRVKTEIQAIALRAVSNVKQHAKKKYQGDLRAQMRAQMNIETGLSAGDRAFSKDIYNGALLYALRNDMAQEIKDLIPMADLEPVSRHLAGKFQVRTPQPALLDEVLRHVELKQVKKIVAKYHELELPLAKIRVAKELLEKKVPQTKTNKESTVPSAGHGRL